jgi:Ni/Fe-hydrogenase subunit HybB-like protein
MTTILTSANAESDSPELVTKAPPWGRLIIADLILSELSAGLFAVAALSELAAPHVYSPVARIGFLMAFPLIVADLFCLVGDLGDPLRFHHMLRVFKIRSPMSTGVWAISLYAVISLICCALAAAGRLTELARMIVGGIGIAPALFVGGYKGVLFSATPQADWKKSRWLSAELVTSAGLLGVAGVLLTALYLPVPAAVEGLRRALIATLFLNLFFSAVTLGEVSVRPLRKFSLLRASSYFPLLLFGWIAPLVLTFVGGTIEMTAAAALILAAAFVYRIDVVMMPHRAHAETLATHSGRAPAWPAERARQSG